MVWEANCVRLFYYLNFGKNNEVLKSKSPCFLLNKNIDFNENETRSKIETVTHTFREINAVLELR